MIKVANYNKFFSKELEQIAVMIILFHFHQLLNVLKIITIFYQKLLSSKQRNRLKKGVNLKKKLLIENHMVNSHYGKLEIREKSKEENNNYRVIHLDNNFSIWHPISGLKIDDSYKEIQM